VVATTYNTHCLGYLQVASWVIQEAEVSHHRFPVSERLIIMYCICRSRSENTHFKPTLYTINYNMLYAGIRVRIISSQITKNERHGALHFKPAKGRRKAVLLIYEEDDRKQVLEILRQRPTL